MNRVNKKYTGVIIPMVSPFDANLGIDGPAVIKIIQSFVEAEVAPFLLGTTGESTSLSDSQKVKLVKTASVALNGKAKLYAGISGNCLEESIELSKKFADIGVDAVVAHLPFYYPIDSDQMLRYYEQLANKAACPLILYNNPITTKHSVPLDVIEKLSYHSNVFGIKDSERGMDRLNESIKLWAKRSDFAHLTGWAAQSAYALLNGSDGIIPSTGNVTPALYKQLYNEALNGNPEKANALQERANLISEIYQKDRNLSQSLPALKVMMASKGLCSPHVLPPIYELGVTEVEKISALTNELV